MGVSAASGGGIRELAGLSKQHHHQAGVVQHLQPGLGLVQKTLVGGGLLCLLSKKGGRPRAPATAMKGRAELPPSPHPHGGICTPAQRKHFWRGNKERFSFSHNPLEMINRMSPKR